MSVPSAPLGPLPAGLTQGSRLLPQGQGSEGPDQALALLPWSGVAPVAPHLLRVGGVYSQARLEADS